MGFGCRRSGGDVGRLRASPAGGIGRRRNGGRRTVGRTDGENPDGGRNRTLDVLSAALRAGSLVAFRGQTGHVVSREQGLQEKYFNLIRPGVSTEDDVWKLWGRCAQKYTFHLVNQHAWMYRYKDFGGFDMAVWPQFDENGVVQSVETTMDPWKEKDGEWLFAF